MKNALIYLIVFIAIQCGVSIGVREVWRMVTGSPDITTMMLVVSMTLFSAITIAIFLLARWCEVARSYVRSRPWTALAWCVVASVGAVIPSTWLQEQMPELPNYLLDEFSMLMGDRWGYLAIGLLAPVAEEIVFRGAILRSLLRGMRNHWVAIAISAVIFAIIHGNPAQMPHAMLVGLLLGWMYYRTDSLVPGVAFHWANNTIAYVLYNVLPAPDATLIQIFGGSQTRVLMAVGFSLCILVPAIIQLNLRMKKAGGSPTPKWKR